MARSNQVDKKKKKKLSTANIGLLFCVLCGIRWLQAWIQQHLWQEYLYCCCQGMVIFNISRQCQMCFRTKPLRSEKPVIEIPYVYQHVELKPVSQLLCQDIHQDHRSPFSLRTIRQGAAASFTPGKQMLRELVTSSGSQSWGGKGSFRLQS